MTLHLHTYLNSQRLMPLKIHCDSQVQIDPGELEKIEEEREREREREREKIIIKT